MQYLAEVIKTTGFMGAKTQLKLLMREQAGYWHPVPNSEELISYDVSNDYGNGVLVFIELAANRNIQHIDSGANRIVGILQSFTRMREKTRSQEEEIEGWKQSLMYQAEALNQREAEFDARRDELQEIEEQIANYDQQLAELNKLRGEYAEQQEHIQRDRQEVENMRHTLHQEQERWEKIKREGGGAGLNSEQLQQVDGILQKLGESLNGNGQVSACLDTLQQQQGVLSHYWQQLEQQNQALEEKQGDIDRQIGELSQQRQEWQQRYGSLAESRQNLRVQHELLTWKTGQAEQLRSQLQQQDTIIQQLREAIAGSITDEVDIQALQQMPMAELEGLVASVQKELQRMSSFVNDQEEELTMQQQAVQELQDKMNQVSEFERLELSAELESERQNFNLLNETLEGQRQRLKEKQASYDLHEQVLQARRDPSSQQSISLIPVLGQMETQRASLGQTLQGLDAEIQQLEQEISTLRESLDGQDQELNQREQGLKDWQERLELEQFNLKEQRGRVAVLQEFLQPVQDKVDQVRQHLEGLNSGQLNGGPQSLISELKQMVTSLANP
ncbi:pilus motility taxis protein HmpF [Candidatus Synechococcus calcipolaris G9]|uniref:Pilus motility taxis protein HmpF n=1 Tax=Candidatus Synechococcus calcipolaris G9 TaxID=1497997 RepID=A0ABT6EZ55_9SYNE|nr:pilus motility taxis protein HmpF [Candidatus Synechococcus calcipolaris]MDG2990858.1 pilus motility taxis protein HmpF [Candidatus Synechococcus calcipolaris G9]